MIFRPSLRITRSMQFASDPRINSSFLFRSEKRKNPGWSGASDGLSLSHKSTSAMSKTTTVQHSQHGNTTVTKVPKSILSVISTKCLQISMSNSYRLPPSIPLWMISKVHSMDALATSECGMPTSP